MNFLIEPKEISINGKTFIISKFPAVAGREIIAKYPLTGLPKIGDYKVNEETMLKLMSYVAVQVNDVELRLSNQALIDNHVGSWENLMRIEALMLEYNCSFFQNGRILNFLEDAVQKAPMWISKILMALSEQSSQVDKQPLMNSKQSIV